MINFKVEVNPFLRKAVIHAKIEKIQYTKIMYFEDIDEWNTFEMANKIFDIQFQYDAEFLVSIYPVEDNKIDYGKPHDVELTFKMTD
jgi:hypothetical protein